MKRLGFYWGFLALAIVLVAYGGYSFLDNLGAGREVPLLGKAFLIAGILLLLAFFTLLLVGFIQKKKNAKKETLKPEEKVEEPQQSEEEVGAEAKEAPVEEKDIAPKDSHALSEKVGYVRREPISRFQGGSAYVKKVGYGPVLRVEEDEIVDMRSNTYYRIEGNMVKTLGGGPYMKSPAIGFDPLSAVIFMRSPAGT